MKNSGKTLHFSEGFICEDMKKSALAGLREALAPAVRVSEDLRKRAPPAIERTLEGYWRCLYFAGEFYPSNVL